jgi:HAD superfamily hydrolase (TIGR01450 family)
MTRLRRSPLLHLHLVKIGIQELLEKHKVFLIDAYGVLVTSSGALPGAVELLELLEFHKKQFFILTNDASRTQESAAVFYATCGLRVPLDRVVSAAMAIGPALDRRGFKNARCFVLGTDDTKLCVSRAGHLVIPISADADCDALVIGDDAGFDFLSTMNALLTALHRQELKGHRPALLLANSDLLYPKGTQAYGFTSGAMAHLLEAGMKQLHQGREFNFEILGKPARWLFELALARAQCRADEAVMIGDQLHTDIQGANAAGIASVIVGTGVTRLPLPDGLPLEMRPNYYLSSLLD